MTAQSDALGTPAGARRFEALLAALVCLTAVSVDMSLPALPKVTAAYGVPSAQGALVVGVFVVGYALGQFIWGPLSDAVGRRPAFLGGLLVFAALAFLTPLSPDFDTLLAVRFVHGMTGGVGPVVGRATIRDIASGARAASLLAKVTAILGLAPLLAPLAGSGILAALPDGVDWQATFWSLGVFACGLAVLVWRIAPETVPAHRRTRLRMSTFLAPWPVARSMAGMAEVRRAMLLVALPFAGYYAILTGSPALLVDVFGFSADLFGPLFAFVAVFWFLGATAARFLVRHMADGVLMRGAAALVLGGGGLALFASVWTDSPAFIPIWTGFALFVGGVGVMLPLATARALAPFAGAAGSAAAVLGATQMLAGAGAAALVAMLYQGSPVSVALILSALGLASAALLLRRP
ncbi:MFS transporter [Yunchengibacter salinarum]|uniref:MFS transporter n=1 Tax=Yunchengibacter salinarum TaxID=3133399 RepID=UPI0035B5F3D0